MGRLLGAAVAVALVSLGGPDGARGQPPEGIAPWTQGSEPLQVDSQSLEARGADGLVVFEGDVVARQGDLVLQADRLEVGIDAETRGLRSALARGAVRISRGDLLATSDQASYDAASGVLVLTGDPKVWRDRDVVAGDRITLYLAEDRSVVEGARAVLFPGPPPEEGR
ncbi:MAG: lipopolysaccharide transport periplasmic protein LptA [Deferrisomatales bacterium]|nr:lipopolysaccharide transport periplasmic protein LptA [Deferrisomatales bacterium]